MVVMIMIPKFIQYIQEWYYLSSPIFVQHIYSKHTPPSITLRSNMPSIRAIEQMGCLEAKRSPCNRQNKTNKPTISKDLNSGLATTLEGIVCHHEAPFSSRG